MIRNNWKFKKETLTEPFESSLDLSWSNTDAQQQQIENNGAWDYTIPATCLPSNLKDIRPRAFNGKYMNLSYLKRRITHKDVAHSLRMNALSIDIPASFSWTNSEDVKKYHPNYSYQIQDPFQQGSCGCCWACATASSLSDRYSIKYNIPTPYLSPVWLTVQTAYLFDTVPSQTCQTGGDPLMALQWLETNTIKRESCWPMKIVSDHAEAVNEPENYVMPNSLPSKCCFNCCDGENVHKLENELYGVLQNSSHSVVITNSDNSVNSAATVASIQKEILNNGPVICGFQVYNDFNDYWQYDAPNKKVYVCSVDTSDETNLEGGHAVCLVGWGVSEDGKRYWVLRNSWGTESGDNGYCKVGFSLDYPANVNLQFDVPINSDGMMFSGGIVAGEAGVLPTERLRLLQNKSMVSNDMSMDSNDMSMDCNKMSMSGTYMRWLLFIVALIIIAFCFYSFVSKNK